MEVLAIIPARGGSKGLPDKNILPLSNHPLIAYSIKAAIDSKLITRVIVSTDSERIGLIAKEYGAEVPFFRPKNLALDQSRDFEVFNYTLHRLQIIENYKPDLIVQLRPTSPLRPIELVDDAIECIKNDITIDSLRAVCESPYTPYKMWKYDKIQDCINPLLELENINEPFNEPRQILPKTYWQIGVIDVIRTDTILLKGSMSGRKIKPYFVSNEIAIDIDDMNSFLLAEKKINEDGFTNFTE